MIAKVLVVDDEASIVLLLKAILQRQAFAVETAGSAKEAIDRLANDSFDAVITDLRMETPLAGFEVVRTATRMHPRPVVLISTAHPVAASDWRSIGADALYLKGGNSFGLPDQLRQLLKRRPESEFPNARDSCKSAAS